MLRQVYYEDIIVNLAKINLHAQGAEITLDSGRPMAATGSPVENLG